MKTLVNYQKWNFCRFQNDHQIIPKKFFLKTERTQKQNTFVEPYLPNNKIGIMHLAAGIWDDKRDMRIDSSVKIQIKTLENKNVSKSLRFGH